MNDIQDLRVTPTGEDNEDIQRTRTQVAERDNNVLASATPNMTRDLRVTPTGEDNEDIDRTRVSFPECKVPEKRFVKKALEVEQEGGETPGSEFYTKSETDALLALKQDKLTDSSSIDLIGNVVSVKQAYVDSQFLTDTEMNDLIEEVYGSEYTL